MRRSVLILDDDEDLRVTMGEVIAGACHAECVVVADVASMIQSSDRVLDCALAILDINLGPGEPSGLDAQTWLAAHGFAGRVVFLTGHAATHPLVRRAMALGDVKILQKPVRVAKLCALVNGAVS